MLHSHVFGRVDLILSKVEEHKWPLVVQGDTRGEMVITAEEAAAIHKKLAQFTSEELVGIYSFKAGKDFSSR